MHKMLFRLYSFSSIGRLMYFGDDKFNLYSRLYISMHYI